MTSRRAQQADPNRSESPPNVGIHVRLQRRLVGIPAMKGQGFPASFSLHKGQIRRRPFFLRLPTSFFSGQAWEGEVLRWANRSRYVAILVMSSHSTIGILDILGDVSRTPVTLVTQICYEFLGFKKKADLFAGKASNRGSQLPINLISSYTAANLFRDEKINGCQVHHL